jgi:hypothetical protein
VLQPIWQWNSLAARYNECALQKPVPLATLRQFSSCSGREKSGSCTEYNPAEFERWDAERSTEPSTLPAPESVFMGFGAAELADSREAARHGQADSDIIIEGESLQYLVTVRMPSDYTSLIFPQL